MKYRKKPVVIEAEHFDGTYQCFLGFEDWIGRDNVSNFLGDKFFVKTLEGEHLASKGDWIIKGVKGEFYPCKPDIFEMTYEPAEPARQEEK